MNVGEAAPATLLRKLTLPIRMAFLMAIAICLQAQTIITTVAGRGPVLTGLGGPATGVPLANPRGIAVDAKGNLYIADNTDNMVFRVSSSGALTVFAGTGATGFSGDGGPGTAATLTEPWAVAVDSSGNVYIADFHNERIRKVDQNGIITTIAGGGAALQTNEVPATGQQIFEPMCVRVDSSGAVYFNDGGYTIRKVTPDGIVHLVAGGNGPGFSGDGGPATKAQLGGVTGIAFDGNGNLYLADLNNNRVRKIDADGNISTVAGNGRTGFSGDGGPATSASLYFPSDVAVDANGNLYIVDQINGCVRRVTPAGTITTVAGDYSIYPPMFSDGVPATSTSLLYPYSIAIDSAGDLYISEGNNGRILRVDATGIIRAVAGSGTPNFAGDGGPATQAALDFPADVKADSAGNLYVADSANHRVRRITPDGTITTIAGNGIVGFSGDGGAATSAQLDTPVGVAVDSSGNVYISDDGNNRIRRVSPGGVITTYAGNGQAGYSGDQGPASSASLFVPSRVSVDAAGDLYVADTLNNRIRKITPSGIITTIAGNGNAGFSGDGGPATQAMLSGPTDVAADQAGNLYIIDGLRVRKVTPDGIIQTFAGLGYAGSDNIEGPLATKVTMDYSWGLAVDRAGNLFLSSGLYLYRINAAGVLTLLVGGGLEGYQEGFDGDGGPAVAAHLMGQNRFSPNIWGMAAGPDGSLYIADTGNDRIRKITNPGAAAQLVVENLDVPFPSFPYPRTGADEIDFILEGPGGPGQSSQRLVIDNAGTGPMNWTATLTTVRNIDWLRISSSSGSAPSPLTVSAETTNLAPGIYWGTILISAPTASNSPRYVSGAVTVPIPILSPASGEGTFTVAEPPGVGWFASSSADWITIAAPAGGNGFGSFSYSVAANPGSTQRSGTLTVANNVSITVTQAAQGPFIQAIVDAFDYTPGVAPGAWVTITGSDLTAGAPQTWNLSGTQQLPTTLAGVTATFNGVAAALYYVSPAQINALVPASIAPGPVQVVVRANGQSSNPFSITATATLPSIYAIPNSDGSAFFVTAALAGTGTLIGNSAVDPRVTRAALPGDVLDLYMAGLGATVDPTDFITNQVFAGAYPVSVAVTASVGGEPAQVLFAGLTSPGLYLVRVALPADLPAGPQPIQVAAGGGKTPSSLMLMVGTPD